MDRTVVRLETVPGSLDSVGLNLEVRRPSNRRQLLKVATSEAHGRLDRSLMQKGYFAGRDGFGLYLRRMHKFQLAFEEVAIAADRGLYQTWGLHHHRVWLEADLSQAGIQIAVSPAAAAKDAPRIADRSSLAGALYVMAGSSLGARVLHRMSVERQLPGPSGSYYLSRLAASVRWSEFLSFLESAEIASEVSMVEGAISTFECVSRHLNGSVSA